MQTPSASVVEKIRKLLAMANHASANVNEAAAAAARAQELLFRHKLSMADLEISTGAREGVGILNVDEETELQLKWKTTLMMGIAQGNYCRLVVSRPFAPNGKRLARMMIVGKPSDAQTVAYMYSYLLNEINRLCDELAAGKGFAYRNSFRVGAADAIFVRLRAQRAEQEKPAAGVSETALVLVKKGDGEIADFMKQTFKKLGKSKGPRVSDSSGLMAGAAAGRTMNLGGGRAALGAQATRIGK